MRDMHEEGEEYEEADIVTQESQKRYPTKERWQSIIRETRTLR